MNETELHNVFVTLTRNPAPSRYGVGSVRAASTRRKRQKWSALGAAVVIGSLIAGTTWLFNPGDSPNPAPNILVPFNEPIDLEGDWVLTTLTDATGDKSLMDAKKQAPSLRFDGGVLTGNSGCFKIAGTYEPPTGDRLDLSNVRRVPSDASIGEDACAGPPFDKRLKDVRHISEADGKLQLHAENWMIIAVLERADAPFTAPAFPCSESDRQPTDLDVPGPGQPTPEKAVGPYADGRQLVLDPSNPNVVYAVNADGSAYRTFRVSRQTDGWWPDGYTQCREGAARPSGDPDPAIWELAPGQNLTADSTEFDVLVTRSGCNSGVTGDVSEPVIDFGTGGKISVSFTVPHSDGGSCPGNDAVRVTVRLGEPIGYRALVDGQCSNTNLATTAFCTPSRGVRWAAQ